MRKTSSIIIAVVLLFSVAAVAAEKLPATATIDQAKAKQAAVTFSHEKHVNLGKPCDTCHHNNKGLTADSTVKVETCASCHMKPQAKVGTMSDMSLQKNPLHIKCVGCHKEMKKGPTTCVGCHPKK